MFSLELATALSVYSGSYFGYSNNFDRADSQLTPVVFALRVSYRIDAPKCEHYDAHVNF